MLTKSLIVAILLVCVAAILSEASPVDKRVGGIPDGCQVCEQIVDQMKDDHLTKKWECILYDFCVMAGPKTEDCRKGVMANINKAYKMPTQDFCKLVYYCL